MLSPYTVVGVDLAQANVLEARRRAKWEALDVRFEQGAFSTLLTQFASKSFDGVLSTEAIVYHEDGQQALDAMSQIARRWVFVTAVMGEYAEEEYLKLARPHTRPGLRPFLGAPAAGLRGAVGVDAGMPRAEFPGDATSWTFGMLERPPAGEGQLALSGPEAPADKHSTGHLSAVHARRERGACDGSAKIRAKMTSNRALG